MTSVVQVIIDNFPRFTGNPETTLQQTNLTWNTGNGITTTPCIVFGTYSAPFAIYNGNTYFSDHYIYAGNGRPGEDHAGSCKWKDLVGVGVGKILIGDHRLGSFNYTYYYDGTQTSNVGYIRWLETYEHKVDVSSSKKGKGSASATVTFIDGGYSSGENLTATIVAKDGYRLTGFTGDTSNASIVGNTVTINAGVKADVFITAQFADVIKLSYNSAGGGSAPAAQSYDGMESSGSFTLAAAPSPPSGKHFTGWSINGSVKQPGETVVLSASSTATAMWDYNPAHKVSFSSNLPAGTVESVATISQQPLRYDGSQPCYEDTEDLTITPARPDGYALSTVVFYYSDNPTVSVGSIDAPSGGSFRLSAQSRNGRDVIVSLLYTQIGYTVSVGIDDASVGVVEEVTPTSATAHYGDVVTLTARVSVGFQFEGWYVYDASTGGYSQEPRYQNQGTAVIDAETGTAIYSRSIEIGYDTAGSVSLIVKASRLVTVDIDYPDGTPEEAKTCAMTLRGHTHDSSRTHFAFYAPLGESFSYALSLGQRTEDEPWYIFCWKDGDGNVLFMPSTGDFTPPDDAGGSFGIHADIRAKNDAKLTLTIATVDGDGNRTSASPDSGDDDMYETTGDYVPQGVAGGHIRLGANDTPVGQYEFEFYGLQYVLVRAVSRAVLGGDVEASAFRGFYEVTGGAGGSEIEIGEEPFSRSMSVPVLLASDTAIAVRYGVATQVQQTVVVLHDGSFTPGTAEFVESTDEDAEFDGGTALVQQGMTVTVSATPRYGWKFKGWFNNEFTDGTPLSDEREYTYPVLSETTIYAAFEKERSRICAWEGSSVNKAMKWRSKVYVLPRPFDPVSARVDATGYPVALSVGTYSSPDADPSRDHEITVKSQDGRRLPRMRPERFACFTVEAESEVDSVVIGTNMSEVN